MLAAKDPHGLYRPASTLKVLTAITLMKALKPNATVIASRRAAAVEPSKVGLIAGDRYRVSDLLKALLMISANDAAIALVQATGSYARGMAMINAEARHLRADDTVAVTPNKAQTANTKAQTKRLERLMSCSSTPKRILDPKKNEKQIPRFRSG